MKSILIANPKGGSGKTTLSTNLAAHFAWQNQRVILGDLDRQKSALQWLEQRPSHLPAILPWDARDDEDAKLPRHADWLVLDGPAGIHGKKLTWAVKQVDRVLVPVQPSPFDMQATRAYLEELLEEKSVRKQHAFVGVIGMRVDPRTRAARELEHFLESLDVPVVAHLRDSQNYINAALEGMALWDLPASRVAKDREQWQALLTWLA